MAPCRRKYSRRSRAASAAESTLPATALRKRVCLLPVYPHYPRNQELGNALAMRDLLRLAIEIDERNAQLTTIIAVDRARRVDDADTAIQREPRTRPHLRFHVAREREGQAGRYQMTTHRRDNHSLSRVSQVDRRRALCAITRQIPRARIIRQLLDQHRHPIHYSTFSTSVYSMSNASATPGYTVFPFTTFSPSASA